MNYATVDLNKTWDFYAAEEPAPAVPGAPESEESEEDEEQNTSSFDFLAAALPERRKSVQVDNTEALQRRAEVRRISLQPTGGLGALQ